MHTGAPRVPARIGRRAAVVAAVRSDLGLRSLAETRLVSWLAVSLSTRALGLLLVLFAPRAADATAVTMRTAPGLAVAFAVGFAIGLPVLAAALGFGVLCATAWAVQRSPAPVPAPGTHVASAA